MKTYTKVFFAVAVAMVMCICPLAVAADNSDAYEIKNGEEKGLYASAKDWDEAKVAGFFKQSYIDYEAYQILKYVVNDYSKFEVSDIKITSMSFETAKASEVKDNKKTTYLAASEKYTISFKATCITADAQNIRAIDPLNQVIKAIGTPVLSVGDSIEIKADMDFVTSEKETISFTKNDAGNFVVTENDYRKSSSETVDIDATYKFTKGTTPASVAFKYRSQTDYSADVSQKYDFNGVDVSKVDENTYAFIDTSADGGFIYELKCTVNDETKTVDGMITSDQLSAAAFYQQYGVSIFVPSWDSKTEKAKVEAMDIKADTYSFIDDADQHLFTPGMIKPADDAEAKKYLADNSGSTSEKFADAKDFCNDNYSAVPDVTQLLNVVLVGVIAVMGVIILVLIIVLIIVAVKKKKR